MYGASSGDEFVDANEGPEHALEERGRAALGEVAAQAAERGVETVTALEHGVPEERIRAVDLVVLGTRRRPDERRSLLGSTTERVARLADQPVSVLKTAVYGRSHSAAQRSTASNTGASDAPFSVSE